MVNKIGLWLKIIANESKLVFLKLVKLVLVVSKIKLLKPGEAIAVI